jgi:hypothetical protein
MLGCGESQKEAIRPDFNRAIMIDFQGATISSDTGFILLREVARIIHEKFLKEERTSAKMLLSPNNQLRSKDVLWKQSAITSSFLKPFYPRK